MEGGLEAKINEGGKSISADSSFHFFLSRVRHSLLMQLDWSTRLLLWQTTAMDGVVGSLTCGSPLRSMTRGVVH